ncbi:MAG TPA: patatin-like phospholipase family protein [Anaeromyxobacteraceae bacterium]|nr:patatin-like phospholipase family protein [Anaeromyxobacteraceae bacterium]
MTSVTPGADLDALRAKLRPFEEAELALLRSVVSRPSWLTERDEAALRYALNLARVTLLRSADGGDLDLEELLDPFRQELQAIIEPLLLRPGGVDRGAAARLAPHLAGRALAWRQRALRAFPALSPAALDREVCEKALVLVCGGGGGVSWSYLGAFALLEQYGLVPRLLAGASMGATLLLLRARRVHYSEDEVREVLSRLTFRGVFRFLETESRYGLPGAMRLYLRQALGELLQAPGGRPLTLADLPIPLMVAVTGIRNGALPHDPSFYEHLLDFAGRMPRPHVVKRAVADLRAVITELITQRDRFARIYLGADAETAAFDAVDAVGFSSALPGVIHYDVLRDDERMHRMLAELFRRHDLFRLMDGGITDNLPARAAFDLVHRGAIGTRNAFLVAFDAFGPKLTHPLWFTLQQLVAQNVARNRPFIGHAKSFQKVLSPVEVIPSASHLTRAIQWGKEELLPEMPLLSRMCRPFALPTAASEP